MKSTDRQRLANRLEVQKEMLEQARRDLASVRNDFPPGSREVIEAERRLHSREGIVSDLTSRIQQADDDERDRIRFGFWRAKKVVDKRNRMV